MNEKTLLATINLTANIIEMKNYVKSLEKENQRLKAQNEILLELLNNKK